MRFCFTTLACFFFAASAGRLSAQSVVLKDGSSIPASELIIGDGKITRSITLSNGQKGQATVNFSDIASLDWSNPQELVNARVLMSQGKLKEAIALLAKAKEFFKQFKGILGNPYDDIVFAHVEALDQEGDFDVLIRVMPEVNSIKWSDDKKLQLRIIKLNMDRRTSPDQDKILSEAESLLADTDDSEICARLWVTIGDIHFKKERWEDAFNAYLHVPVFYGSQAALVPQAELLAARCLVKQERFKDAGVMFQRISDAYKGSEVGEAAKKEFLTVNGMQNKPDKPKQTSNDSKKKTETKT